MIKNFKSLFLIIILLIVFERTNAQQWTAVPLVTKSIKYLKS